MTGFWSGRTALVTGATGFLGGWVVRRLLDAGANVVAIVRRPAPRSQFELAGFDQRVTIVPGSIYDPAVVEAAFSHPIDTLFHVAALADVGQAKAAPVECFRSTIESTWLLLEQVRARPGCVAVINSSDKAYGPQPPPYHEELALRPIHPYEVAKAAEDHIAQSYGKIYGVPTAITRCANYFGGFDFNFDRIVPGTIRSALRGEPIVLRSDGRFTRDFLYVEDAADVQLMVAEGLADGRIAPGEPWNFSLEVKLEIFDLVRTILRHFPGAPEPKAGTGAVTEIRHMAVASDKARQRLGWKPAHTLEQALGKTVAWYRDHADTFS